MRKDQKNQQQTTPVGLLQNICGKQSRGAIATIHDDRIDRLGVYYCHFKVGQSLGITFERFVEMVDSGAWARITA